MTAPGSVSRALRALTLASAVGCAEAPEGPPEEAARPTPTAQPSLQVRSEPIQPIRRPDDLRASHVELGRKLFHDKRLSATGDVACASCHFVNEGGADHLQHARGVRAQVGLINTPSVLNSGLNFAQFWDGRAATLEEQVGSPLTNPTEMGFTWAQALEVIRRDPTYAEAFQRDFDGGVTEANVRVAIATYERALVTPSRFDKWLLGDAQAITEDERKGYELFKSLGCVACHQGRNVGGNMFQRFGVMGDYFKDRGDITLADYGRYNVTKSESDRFVFRVPSLRNVEKTAPYFHDGTQKTLPDAIRTMARYQLGRMLSDADVVSLERFLKTLTGDVPSGLGPPGGGGSP